MPEFTTVSIQEAQIRTISDRRGQFINEYAQYIQQVPKGQAGRLRGEMSENPLAIRRHLAAAAKVMHITLIIKRSGNDVYFWWEDGGDEQPRRKRSYKRAMGRKEIPAPDQPVDEIGMVEQGIPEEESPELGQAS